jgi:hypothetical protein
LVPGEAAAMRRVQAPIRGCVELSINHLEAGTGSAPSGTPVLLMEQDLCDGPRTAHRQPSSEASEWII